MITLFIEMLICGWFFRKLQCLTNVWVALGITAAVFSIVHVWTDKITLISPFVAPNQSDVISTYIYRIGTSQDNIIDNPAWYTNSSIINALCITVVSVAVIWYLLRMQGPDVN